MVDVKEFHESKHSAYSFELASLIEESQFECEEVLVEQEYGEYMNFDNFQHIKGKEYGDLDVLVETDEGCLYIEVKTNPSDEDILDGKKQMAKAAYLLEDVDYTISLTDEEINQLTSEKISKWDLQTSMFEPDLWYLTLDDAQKTKPKQYELPQHEKNLDPSDFNVESDFAWSDKEVKVENLPDKMPRANIAL